MIKSKIPLPSKRSAQSSIPLPTKSLGTQSKELPLNSKKAVSKKLISTQQAPSNFSKTRDKEENIKKRLSSYKSHDSKNVAALNKKPTSKSCNVKNLGGNKAATENKLIKQTKPVPLKSLPKIVISSEPEIKKENQSKRFSSFQSHNGKSAALSNAKPRAAIKSATQMKGVNSAKQFNNISSNNVKENSSKNPSVREKERKLAIVSPIKQINTADKSDVDDSEFKDSHFFKSLILNQRELSPGIIKYCSKAKFLSPEANVMQPQQKASFHFQTADEFVEEVKRTSSKYHRFNGRLVLHSPVILKQKEMSAEDFVQEVKRNSAKFLQRQKNWVHSPSFTSKSSFQRMPHDIVSVKENIDIKLIDEVRRLSELRKQPLQNPDLFMANRRWTCNVPSKPSIANMNASEIAAELRRISEIRRESGAHLYKKTPFKEHLYSVGRLNPHEKALREIECLTAKKKDRMKKKVTFSIPSSGSPLLTASSSAKSEAKLSDISEGSSHTCTPELDLGCGKVITTSQSGEAVSNEDTSIITTPELNLTSYKLNFESSPNDTLPFDALRKNNASIKDSSSVNQTFSSRKEESTVNKNSEQCSQNSNANLISSKPDFLSKFSSFKIIDNNICISQDSSDRNLPQFENPNMKSDSYSEFYNLKSTDSLFQSAHRLAVPTNYHSVNETEKFCVNAEKIYTPHPINLHSKSNVPSDVSPSFLAGKFSTLNCLAPICTPMVMKNLSHSPGVNLSHIRQKLDFNEKPNSLFDRRESQIIVQSIPTIQKMNDYLCDQECIILSSQSSEEDVFLRNLQNPIAVILSNGDEMHFIPINSP